MENALKIYNATNKRILALEYVSFVTSWDAQTEEPSGAEHADETATLAEMEYELKTSPEYLGAIKTLAENADKLPPVLRHEVLAVAEETADKAKIPASEYADFSRTTTEFYSVYVEAKKTNNFALALPYYKKIVAYRRKYAKWLETEGKKGYDVLLDDFEKGLTAADCDRFFALLREKLVPLIEKIGKCPKPDYAFAKRLYPVDGQKQFEEYLRSVIGFDEKHTVMKESEHPFTNGYGTTDVRITNHFHEDSFDSAIYSAIHEMGHGMYELQVSPELNGTLSGGGVSMAMHESQSRMLENMVGRSRAFWDTHFSRLAELFPEQLSDVTAEDMYRYSNKVEPSLIRTDADELTYPLHIMVRYELEKLLVSGEIEAEDIPAKWNALYKEYLGIDVPTDTVGCLQDVHWAYGEFGYFPTYAIGSAYAAQIYHAMEKDIDVDAEIRTGKLDGIEAWLKEHIHKYGSSLDSKDILKLATGEDFNPEYYVDYLTKKYSAVYGIEA